jgi:hypothetical protein
VKYARLFSKEKSDPEKDNVHTLFDERKENMLLCHRFGVLLDEEQ